MTQTKGDNVTEQLGSLLQREPIDKAIASPEPVAINKVDETNLPQPARINENVLQNTAVQPAYMDLMLVTALCVAVLGGAALLFAFVLAMQDKPVPEWLGGVVQWSLIILGVLLVGETIVGKLSARQVTQ